MYAWLFDVLCCISCTALAFGPVAALMTGYPGALHCLILILCTLSQWSTARSTPCEHVRLQGFELGSNLPAG